MFALVVSQIGLMCCSGEEANSLTRLLPQAGAVIPGAALMEGSLTMSSLGGLYQVIPFSSLQAP